MEKKSDKLAVSSEEELTAEEKTIFETLKEWRLEKSSELNIPSFMVCHNIELMTVESPLINPIFQKVEKCIILGFLFVIILATSANTIICIL